jgi:hypothetical protein
MTTLTVKSRPLTLTVPGEAAYSSTYDWYVDSVNGLDSYSGQKPWYPFKTIAKLLTVLDVGDSVYLQEGSHWREKLNVTVANVTVANVTVASIGGATAPLLDCSDIAANASFTKTGGQTNVYQIAVTVDYSASEPMFNTMWENDVRLVRATSVANCDATPGSMYASNDNNANVTLYVHASDSSSAITNGKTYEYAKWLSGFYSYNVSGTTVNGIRARRCLSEGGCIKVGKTSNVLNCFADEGGKHSVYVREGCYVYNTVCSKAYFNPASPSKAYFIYNEDNPAGGGEIFENCSVDNGGVYDTNAQAFFGHYNISGSFGVIRIINPVCADMGSCFDIQHVTSAIITNPTMTNCRQISSVPSDTTITGGSLLSSVANSTPFTFGSGAGKTLTINGGFTFGPIYTAQNALIFATSAQTINLDDVDLAAVGAAIQIWLTAAGSTVTINECQFSYGPWVIYAPNGITLTSDYNTFADASSNFQIGATAYTTLALYQAGTGQDAHSTVG